MANEIKLASSHARVIYFVVLSRTGTIYNTSSQLFEVYNSSNYSSDYTISMTEQGTASGIYLGSFPSAIVPGVYDIIARQQIGGSPAETDPTMGVEDSYQWNGSFTLPLSDLSTSGQIGQVAPIRLARGVQILNFPIYLKSAADHITPFTSGVLSGQISRDGAAYTSLQSGHFTEVGLGGYSLQALTSGDLLANTVMLLVTANGISGGTSDPLPLSFILQRTSGQ